MEVTPYLNVTRLLAHLKQSVSPQIDRSTLYRWRKKLDMVQSAFSPDEVAAITIYGKYVRSGFNSQKAMDLTISELKRQGK